MRVNGQFKLADFGFAKFVKRAEKDEKAPQSYIEGGTEAFGAPEVAQARLRKTKIEVTQTIDTWSFGCVLSVAATWVILGFQGIEQFRALRTIAAKKDGGTATDRFHDGDSVLPDIKQWHNYLIDHVRVGDTITPLVLELIESKMLLKNPDDRLTSRQLCERLEKVIRHAKIDHQESVAYNKETSDSVKRALLTIEKAAAPPGNASQARSNAQKSMVELQDVTDGTVSNQNPHPLLFNPSIRASNRVGKDKKMNIPFAKTPHRQEILEEELKSRYLVSAASGNGEGLSCLDNGTPTDSLTNMDSPHPLNDASGKPLKHQPRTPKAQGRLPNDGYGWALPLSGRMELPPIEESTPSRPTPSLIVTDTNKPPTLTEFDIIQRQDGKGKAKVEEKEELRENPVRLPEDVFGLPYEICKTRQYLQTKGPRGTIEKKLKSFWKKESKDSHLETFIFERDLVLVIDNGTSMLPYWPIVTFVAVTLAMKIAGLDDDGYDVRFTINGRKHDKFGLKGAKGLETLKKTLESAEPEQLKQTDMSNVLDSLFRKSRQTGYRKATTLLVLTDGAWKGTVPANKAESKIVEFAKDLEKAGTLDRHYTLGFIRFGDEFRERLKALDDELSEKYQIW